MRILAADCAKAGELGANLDIPTAFYYSYKFQCSCSSLSKQMVNDQMGVGEVVSKLVSQSRGSVVLPNLDTRWRGMSARAHAQRKNQVNWIHN